MDLIRSGKAPKVIFRKGAEGNLPLPAEDRIEILSVLASDPAGEWRARALATLKGWDRAEIRRVLASPQTAPEVLRLAAQDLVPAREELREILLWNPSLPGECRALLQPRPAQPVVTQAAELPSIPFTPEPAPPPAPPPGAGQTAKEASDKQDKEPADELAGEKAAVEIMARLAAGVRSADVEVPDEATKRDDELTQQDRETLIQKVSRMSVVEKIKAALTGNMETRSLLVRDANKIVSRAVLQSPKISDTEAESYASAKNVSEEVLRLIAVNRKFMKSYPVMRALVNNPRAPIDVTMPLIGRINERDLKGLSLNRNIPDVIRSLATKAIKQKEEAGKSKLPGRH